MDDGVYFIPEQGKNTALRLIYAYDYVNDMKRLLGTYGDCPTDVPVSSTIKSPAELGMTYTYKTRKEIYSEISTMTTKEELEKYYVSMFHGYMLGDWGDYEPTEHEIAMSGILNIGYNDFGEGMIEESDWNNFSLEEAKEHIVKNLLYDQHWTNLSDYFYSKQDMKSYGAMCNNYSFNNNNFYLHSEMYKEAISSQEPSHATNNKMLQNGSIEALNNGFKIYLRYNEFNYTKDTILADIYALFPDCEIEEEYPDESRLFTIFKLNGEEIARCGSYDAGSVFYLRLSNNIYVKGLTDSLESVTEASLEKKFGYYEAYSESSDGSYLYSWYNEDQTVKFSIELSNNKISDITFEVKSY